MRRPVAIALSMLLVFMGTSCSTGKFTKNELFADYGAGGRAKYYRVTTRGYGKNGKVNYRSGWYSRRAVDSLFSSIGAKETLAVANARRTRKALITTFDRYMSELERDEIDEGEIAKRKKAYLEVVEGLEGLASVGEGQQGSVDHASEKYVMVFSSDPEAVIEALQGKVSQIDLGESISQLLGASVERERRETETRLRLLSSRTKRLSESLGTRASAVAGAPIIDIQAMLTSLIAELEVQAR